MKLKLQTIITCLLLLISFTAKSQTYDATEVAKLRAFLDQTDGVTTNGLKIAAGYLSSDPTTWTGITWDGGSPTQKISKIDFNYKLLTGSADLSNLTSLTDVKLHDDSLTTLDVSGCTALTNLDCSNNKITTLITSGCTSLSDLNCSYNKLTTLVLTQNTALTNLNCQASQLKALDLTSNTALTTLNCRSNSLTTLVLTQNTALDYLDCSYNQLTALDVHLNIALTDFRLAHNNLTILDLSKNTALTYLQCSANPLTVLDVHLNTALINLECVQNQLTALDLSKNTALATLDCGTNYITALDLSNNTVLSSVYCNNNKLTALDVHLNTALTNLNCGTNYIKVLDVTKNTLLTDLICIYNELTSLDLTSNISLQHLVVYENELKFSDMQHSNTVLSNILTSQHPFIPIGVDTSGGTMAAAVSQVIDLTKETNINAIIGNTTNITTFHVWKKAWDGTISDVTAQCNISLGGTGVGGFITLPTTAGEFDSLFITMSNPTYPDFVERTDPATALSSKMRTRLFAFVGSSAVLPIELLSFTANLNNNKVNLAWSTASEKNNAFFTVERSTNEQNWESVAKINGAGNSNTQLNYSTIDANPLSGVSYYRLKQTDFDGKFEYSKTVVIDRNAKTTIKIYPNPATNEISVIGNEDDLNSIKIYNSLGQDVTKYTNYSASNTKQITIDISKLTTGIYILKTKNTTNRLIVK